MKSKRQITNRIIVIALLLVAQIVITLVIFLTNLREYSLWFWIIFSVLGQATAIYIIAHDSHPSYRIVWLAAVLLLPIFGTLAYIFYGRLGQSKTLKSRFSQFDKEQLPTNLEKINLTNTRLTGLSQYLWNEAKAPLWADTDVKYYPVGEALFADMLEDLKEAEQFIFLEYFIIQEGKMWEAFSCSRSAILNC